MTISSGHRVKGNWKTGDEMATCPVGKGDDWRSANRRICRWFGEIQKFDTSFLLAELILWTPSLGIGDQNLQLTPFTDSWNIRSLIWASLFRPCKKVDSNLCDLDFGIRIWSCNKKSRFLINMSSFYCHEDILLHNLTTTINYFCILS